MSALPQRVKLLVEGTTTPSIAQDTVIKLDKIQPLRQIEGGITYLCAIYLEFVGTMLSSSGTVNVQESHVYDMIDRITLNVPGRTRQTFKYLSRAGSIHQKIMWGLTGRKPSAPNGGGGVAGGAGTSIAVATDPGTPVRFTIVLPFYFPGGIKESDWGTPLAQLRGQSELTIGWANPAVGTTYGANVSYTGTLAAYAELIEQDEFRVPPPFYFEAVECGAIEDEVNVAQRLVHFMAEVPVHANGIADKLITTTNRDLVTVTVNGREPIKGPVPAETLGRLWSYKHAVTRLDELSHQEVAGLEFLPLYWSMDRPGARKATQVDYATMRAQFQFTGDDSTPRIAFVTSDLLTEERLVKAVGDAGVAPPPGFAKAPQDFVTVKTFSKNDAAAGAAVAARLPLKLSATRVRNSAAAA